jgi:superfamily II DNA/RNA helicase
MIVYCNSRSVMTQICDTILRSHTIEGSSYHHRWRIEKVLKFGIQLIQNIQENEAVAAACVNDSHQIWIVTDQMAGTLDKSTVSCIIHYELPFLLRDSFVPRMIRAGREPNSRGGVSIAFATQSDLEKLNEYYDLQLNEFTEMA